MRLLGQVGVVGGISPGGGFGGFGGSFLGPFEGHPTPESGPITNNGPLSVSAGPATGAPIYPVINFVCRPGQKDGMNLVCRYEEGPYPAWQQPRAFAWSSAPMNGW